MDRVVINGTSYAAPFRHLFRPHTPAEHADLADDVRRNGIQYPVLVATTPGRGRLVIDGLTRAEIATGFGMEVLVADFGDVTDEWAESRARALNVHRRHLTADERAAEVAKLRATGVSNRAIAAKLGVSEFTVRRDLGQVRYHIAPDDEDEEDDDPQEPTRVTGLDGKSYPATRPAPVVAFKMPPDLMDRTMRRLFGNAHKALKSLLSSVREAYRQPESDWHGWWSEVVGGVDLSVPDHAGEWDWPGVAAWVAAVGEKVRQD